MEAMDAAFRSEIAVVEASVWSENLRHRGEQRSASVGQNQSFRNLTQIAREWAFKASGRTMRLDYGECACELESVAGPLWR